MREVELCLEVKLDGYLLTTVLCLPPAFSPVRPERIIVKTRNTLDCDQSNVYSSVLARYFPVYFRAGKTYIFWNFFIGF